LVSLPWQALAAQTLSIKGREERVKKMGVMSSSVHSPGDHDEESLPLPPGIIHQFFNYSSIIQLLYQLNIIEKQSICMYTIQRFVLIHESRNNQ